MDSPNLVSLPVEVVLLIAEQLTKYQYVKRRDILNLMQVYFAPRGYNRDTARLFQKLMFRISARQMILHWNEAQYALLPATCWTIAGGDVELTRCALAEYQTYHESLTLDRLLRYDDRWDGSTKRVVKANLWRFPGRVHPGTIRNPTPVMLAVLSGNIDVLKFVLESRTEQTVPLATRVDKVRHTIADGNDRHFFYVSALGLAAHMGRLGMVSVLVEAGAKVNWTRDKTRDNIRGREYNTHLEEQDITVLGSICGWGVGKSIYVSEEQQSGQLDVLRYFLERDHPIDETGCAVSWEHCDNQELANSEGFDTTHICRSVFNATDDLSVRRTPLWHTIWSLNAKLVPHAVFLIRHGARWAPWTAWEGAPWPRERIHDPW